MVMKQRLLAVFIAACFFISALPALAAGISIHTDRLQIREGDMLSLTIRLEDLSKDAKPDLSPLEKDFDIHSRTQSTHTSFINGSVSRRLEIHLTLMPKKAGKLEIPALEADGHSSTPRSITVLRANEPDSSGKATPLFITASVDNKKPYIQEQIVYTIKIYDAVGLLKGGITLPKSDDILSGTLIDQKSYQETKNGTPYNVTEHSYAFYPQKSGEITLSPTYFEGLAPADPKPRRRSLHDPFAGVFGPTIFDRLHTNKTVRSRTQPLSLTVRPKPASYPKDAVWLPAQDLILTDALKPDEDNVRNGETLSRVIALQATGLTAAQIPELSMPTPKKMKQYPGETESNDIPTKKGLLGTINQTVVLIPTDDGKTVLPEITLPWWDTDEGRMKTARLPARHITILPAAGTASVQPPKMRAPKPIPTENERSTQPSETMPQPSAQESPAPQDSNLLISLLIASNLLLGGGILFLLFRRKKAPISPLKAPETRTALLRDLKNACSCNDPKAANAALLAWGRTLFQDDPPTSTGSLAARLDSDDLKHQCDSLNRALYAPSAAGWDGAPLYEAAQQAGRHKSGKKAPSPLPNLY